MALALAFDAAKKDQRKDGCHTHFFGSRKEPDLPLASLNQHNQGYFTGTHFHTADQFQIVVQGEGTLGRHALAPYTVHFTRAYTPYGPLTSNTQDGIAFFVMRTHAETGAQFIPEQLEQLRQVPDRRPWQASSEVTIPALQSGADVLLQANPDIKDEHGLAVHALSMKPNTQAHAPDPSHGDGQYLVIVKGSLLYQNKEHKALALVFVYPKEGPFELRSGPEGLEAVVLNFPRPQTRAATHVQAVPGFKTWQCALCSFVYNEAAGLSEEGIAPGTRWQDVPDSWSCPDCSASKSDFQMVEL